MQLQTIKFTADEQSLQRTSGGSLFASSTVSYIRALFDLGDNWGSWGAVRAVWKSRSQQIATVLADGACMVPAEVLANPGQVYVNLVASEVSGNVVTDRLTSYPVLALVVDAQALVDGSETAEITPSQFEQFVAAVEGYSSQAIDARNRAEAAQEAAETAHGKAEDAQDLAEYAQEKAETAQGKAEDAQEAAEAALHEFTTPTASADTLQPGSAATAAYSAGHFTFGIPQGEKGDPGATPDISIGSVTTGEPGTDAAASITGTAENPVLNLTIPRGDTGEVSQEELYDLLPVESASGSIASFIDGAKNVPLKSLVVDIDPVQDLHGFSNPWPGGAVDNKLSFGEAFAETINGITIKSDGRGTYTLSGTASDRVRYKFNIPEVTLPDTCYIHVHNSAAGSTAGAINIEFYNGETRKDYWGFSTANRIGNSTSALGGQAIDALGFLIESGEAISGTITVSPMALTTGTATDFIPWANICPISGRTGGAATRCGKNLIDGLHGTVGAINNQGPILTNWTDWHYQRVKVKAGDKLTPSGFTRFVSSSKIHYRVLDGSGNLISVISKGGSETLTVPGGALYIELCWQNDDNNTVQLELGSSATAYSPYQVHSISLSFGQTVYGGEDEIVSGAGLNTMQDVDLGALTWAYNNSGFMQAEITNVKTGTYTGVPNAICSNYKTGSIASVRDGSMTGISVNATGYVYVRDPAYTNPTTFKSSMNGVKLVYEVQNPSSFSTTPAALSTLLGDNNIFSDCGDVSVEYRADIQLFVNKMLANALSA